MLLHSYSTIAIVQTAFLGDVALSMFFVEEVRMAHPSARIIVVTTPKSAPLVRCCASVDEVIEFDKRGADSGIKGILRVARRMRDLGVDLVFGLQRSARTAIVARLCGARACVGFAQATASFLYTTRVTWELSKHETQRNHELLSVFTDIADVVIPDKLRCIPEVISEVNELRGSQQIGNVLMSTRAGGAEVKRVVLAPGSVWFTKRWPEDHWVTLATKLVQSGSEVTIMGGSDDFSLCVRIADRSGATCPARPLSLQESLRVLANSDVLVTNDSAPTHMAAMVGTRTITIYGSTVPAFGFAPRGPRDVVVENTSLTCRPCGLHGKRSCPLGTMECMTSILPQKVMDLVNSTTLK